MSLDYNQIVARFFAARVGLLTNARRVIVLTQIRFMAYDESDVIKETHPYTDLLEITPSKLKPDEFIIQWQGGSKETYVCPHRNYLISSMIRLNEINKKAKPVKYRAFQLTRAGERFECTVAVGGASIEKYEANSERLISTRWLTDISRVFKFTRERDHGIEVRYLDGTYHQYSFSSEDRANVLAALRKSVSTNFGNELFIEEVTFEDLLGTHSGDQDAMLSELSQERVIYDTLVKMESKKRPNKSKNVHLRLTMSKILVEHESNKFLSFARSVTTVIKMRSYGDNEDKFTIEFSDGKVCVFHSAQKELILTSILDLAKWNNHKNLCLMYGDSANGSKVGTPTSEYNPDWTFYFLRRTSSLTEKTEPNELQFIVDEFNQNIPLIGDTIKDKKVIYVFFGLLKLYVPYQATNRRIVMSLLNGIHRSLSFRGSFDEVTRIPNCMPSLVGFIQQTTDECVSYAASFVLNAMSVGNGQSPKSEAANKEIIYTGENTAALLAMLMRNSDAKLNPLLVSALLSMLESTLSLNAHSTPREVARKLLSNFFSYVEILFQLARFPCTSIVKSTSIVLYVLMKNCDDKMFKRIQDLARSTMGLLWQIRLAFDSPLQEQRQVSWDLVIMMVDGNNESMKLLQRMFPADIIRELTGDGTLKPRFANKNPQAMMQQPQTPNQPANTGYAWEKFFECLQQNYETPTLIWNGSLRYELVFAIGQELAEFDKEKEMNPNKKYTWNYEEFTIKYMSIANELKVGNYYINILLKRLPNVTISNATLFLEKLFYRLITESINENRISYLKAMTWCYAQYHEEIGRIHFMDNLVYMLQSWTNPAVLAPLLAFLLELFVLNDNIASFLDHGGATEITRILTLLHLPQPSKKVNPLQIGSVCLKLLARLMLTQQSSIDESGNIKIPIPRLKRQLSEKVQLQAIVSIFLAGSEGLGAQLAEQAAGILEYITDYNEAVIGNIYKTGLFYFIFFYQEYATEANFIKLAKLVAKLHLRQLHTPGVSVLKNLLPAPLLETLEQQGYDAFSKKFFGDTVSEELVWNKACRKFLAEEIAKHIEEYRGRIRGSAKSVGVFEWKPMDDLVYDFEYLKNVVVVDSPRKQVEPIRDLKQSVEVKVKEEPITTTTPAVVTDNNKRAEEEAAAAKKEEQRKKEEAAAKLEEELKNQIAEEERKRKEEQEKAEEERKKQEVEFLKEEQRRKLEEERRQIEDERKKINEEKQRMDEDKKRNELDEERKKLEEERKQIEEAKRAIQAEKQRVEEEKQRKIQEEENLKQEAENRKREEEKQKLRAEEEKQRAYLEEERRKLDEERRKLGEHQQKQQEEEKKKKEDELREALRTMEEERKRIEEERRTIEEEKKRMEEEKKRKDEEEERRRFEEEKRQVEEEKRKLEDNKKKNEQDILSQLEEQRKFIEEEKKRLEEEKRQIEEERKKREAANQTKLFGFLPTKQTKP